MAINAFNKLLIVKQTGKYTFSSKDVNEAVDDFRSKDIPYLIKNSSNLDKDLFLIPYVIEMDENVDAAAYPIFLDGNNNRPIMGGVMLGNHYQFSKTNSVRFLAMLLLHEISHVLGFNEYLFQYFIGIKNPTKTVMINGIERTLLRTPKVVEYARGHFGCPTLSGVELENQGGSGSAGSHWEARLMLGDYMISTDYPELVISDITLALFEDTGWYEVNYYTGGLFKTGKGEGCNFLQLTCIDNETNSRFPLDFCNDINETCTPGLLDRGDCYYRENDEYIPSEYQYFNDNYSGFEPSDFCPVSMSYPYSNYYLYSRCDNYGLKSLPDDIYENFGPNNFCFKSSLIENSIVNNTSIEYYKDYLTARCYKVTKCNPDTLSYSVEIDSGMEFNCTEAYETKINNIEGYEGIFICPPYWRVCGGTVLCNDPFECIEQMSITQMKDSFKYVIDKTEYIYKEIFEDKNSNNLAIYNLWLVFAFIVAIL